MHPMACTDTHSITSQFNTDGSQVDTQGRQVSECVGIYFHMWLIKSYFTKICVPKYQTVW